HIRTLPSFPTRRSSDLTNDLFKKGVKCGKEIVFTHIIAFYNLFNFFRRRQWHPTPVLLPGKSHGRRSLVGCSPWGCKELDTTERDRKSTRLNSSHVSIS